MDIQQENSTTATYQTVEQSLDLLMTAFEISKESDSLAVDDNLVGVLSENVSPTVMPIDSSIEAPTAEDADNIDSQK